MGTFSDTSQNGAGSVYIFGSSDMLEALTLLADVAAEAIRVKPEIAVRVREILSKLEADLLLLAQRTAVTADAAIEQKLIAGQRRPNTTRDQHLTSAIRSEPMRFGSVRIAMIDDLDRVTNPEGYGPYWRAIEYGSEAVGNQMTGRVLFGTFVGPGHDDVPRSDYAGVKGAPGSEFVFGKDAAGEAGFGTIQHEIEPRYFIRDGAEEAAGFYGGEIHRVATRYAQQIEALMSS